MTHPGNGEGFQLMGAVGMEQGKWTTEESRAACRDCQGAWCAARRNSWETAYSNLGKSTRVTSTFPTLEGCQAFNMKVKLGPALYG